MRSSGPEFRNSSEEDKRWLESYSSLHKVSVAEAIRQRIRKLGDGPIFGHFVEIPYRL